MESLVPGKKLIEKVGSNWSVCVLAWGGGGGATVGRLAEKTYKETILPRGLW